jgi:translation initiation factor 4A
MFKMSDSYYSVKYNNRHSEMPSVASFSLGSSASFSALVSDDVSRFKSWKDMNLRENLLRGIYNYSNESPTEVQQKAIMPCIEGKDVVLQAESWTGKTATLGIATLQLVDPTRKACQAIILATTHELAQQICKVITSLSQYEKIECCDFIERRHINEDTRKIQNLGVQVAVGTPGRILALIKSKREIPLREREIYTKRFVIRQRKDEKPILNTKDVKLIVIDEADEMLLTNLFNTVQEIFGVLDGNIQVVLSSATMPPKMLDITDKILRKGQTVYITKSKEELRGIKEHYGGQVEIRDEKQKDDVFEDNVINENELTYTNGYWYVRLYLFLFKINRYHSVI